MSKYELDEEEDNIDEEEERLFEEYRYYFEYLPTRFYLFTWTPYY